MRKLDRASVAAPASLAGPGVAVANEIAAALAYYQARTPWTVQYVSYEFSKYRSDDVKLALRALANSKCAYCESKIAAVRAEEVEHYRPKGGIDNEPLHPGYWWLAHDWDNLLPTCRGCNHRLRGFVVTPDMTTEEIEKLRGKMSTFTVGKGNQFGIAGARVPCPPAPGTDGVAALALEQPLLIDPCRTDPELELAWAERHGLSTVDGAVRPDGSVSPSGTYTAMCCALNRLELVDERTEVLDELRVQRTYIIEDIEAAENDPDKLAQALARAQAMRRHAAPTKRYSAMASAYVDQLLQELRQWIADAA